MNREQIRAALYAKQLKLEDVALGIFPELEEAVLDADGVQVIDTVPVLDDNGKPVLEANGQPSTRQVPKVQSLVAVRELNGTEIQQTQKDVATSAGKLLAYALVVKDTKEQVFALTEIQSIMDTLGNSTLEPLLQQAAKLSGMITNAQAVAKNG